MSYQARNKRRKVRDPKRKWDFKTWWFVVLQNLKGINTATRVLVGFKRVKSRKNRNVSKVSKTTRIVMLGPNAKCVRCGNGHDKSTLTMDHIIPVSKGGKGGKNNCQVMCEDCNQLKGDNVKRYHPKELKVSIGERMKHNKL